MATKAPSTKAPVTKTPSTAVAKAKFQLPAAQAAALAAEMAMIQKRIAAPSGDRITVTQAKKMRLPSGIEIDELECIVIDFTATNSYYTESFDRNNIVPPVCFAIGLEPSGLVPSDSSPDKQCESCAGCWANQWKSSLKGGNGKACSNARLLAIIPTAPDADNEYPMYIMKASTTAIKSFDGHVGKVAQSFGVPVRYVVTRVTMSDDDYSSLRFSVVEPASKELIQLATDKLEEARARLLVEPDVSAYVAANDEPKKKNARAPAKKVAGARR